MKRVPETADFVIGSDGVRRCWWCGDDPLYVQYHDTEWGRLVSDDRGLFEKMCLEGFQAGLSWITILRKRDAFRSAFCNFDVQRVARFSPQKVEELLLDARIVRHRGKIESTINNAKRTMDLLDEFGSLEKFFWRFEPEESSVLQRRDQMPANRPESVVLSKELKQRGWSFVGPTTCYSLMQAMGMVNDHLRDCPSWQIVDRARSSFARPR